MENLQSVCYVARVNEVKPIEGADLIEEVIVGGWGCIARKGLYMVDELVAVATTDAVIPEGLAYELGVTSYLRNGNRVRTIKLKGVYSECLLIPVHGEEEGTDMMSYFGIVKYEPPIRQVQLSSGRKIKYKDNPNFGVYYKFPNLKNVPGMFTENDNVQITRKIHGTNARYGYVLKRKLSIIDRIKIFFGDKFAKYEFVYGSHNVEKGSDSQGYYDTNVWLEAMNKYDIKNKLKEFAKAFILNNTEFIIGSGVVLYGEIYGPGIQKGYDYELNDIKFAGFDLVVNGEYQSPINAQIFINHYLELPHVPVLFEGQWSQKTQDSLVLNNFIGVGRVPHEGVVIKHVSGHRQKVAKVINPDYLIYAEKHNVGDSH